jgi:hypothetical protein
VHPAELVVIEIESVAPEPVVVTAFETSSTETEKLGSVAPVVVPMGGCVVNTTCVGVPAADAGDAVTRSAPVARSAELAPTERTLLSVERSDRPPPRFLMMCMVIPLSIKSLLSDIN